MTKFTWKALEKLLEGQYKLTPDDAMQIVLDNLLVKIGNMVQMESLEECGEIQW